MPFRTQHLPETDFVTKASTSNILTRLLFCISLCMPMAFLQAGESDKVGFVKSSKYLRPYSVFETRNDDRYLLGPTGIFAYGPGIFDTYTILDLFTG